MRWVATLFQSQTFTSFLWAFILSCDFLVLWARMSTTCSVPSDEPKWDMFYMMQRRRTVLVRRRCLRLSPDGNGIVGQWSNGCNFGYLRRHSQLPCRLQPIILQLCGDSKQVRTPRFHRESRFPGKALFSCSKDCSVIVTIYHLNRRFWLLLLLGRYRSRRQRRGSCWVREFCWHRRGFPFIARQVWDPHHLSFNFQGHRDRHRT